VYDYLHELRQQGPELIRQRLTRGIADGDLPADAPVAEMTSFYTTVMQGIAVRARDGASRQALIGAAKGAMAAWDPMLGRANGHKRPKSRRKSA
jgi:hypothetical protein